MAERIPARLSAAEGRNFGLTVGGAFVVIAGLLTWRGRLDAAIYAGVLGLLLFEAGLVFPTRLGPVQRAWMGLAHLISRVTTPIFMGVVYFLVLTPIALGMHLAGRRPLAHRVAGKGYWFDRAAAKPEPSRMERQF